MAEPLNVRAIEDADVRGKTVLVRADLNVPMEGGRITDTTRIDRFAPTAKMLSDKGARVVVISHFGRPKGEANPDLSLAPVAKGLAISLGQPVRFIPASIGEAAQSGLSTMAAGDIALLENLRFHAGEEANDPGFAHQLAALGDLYVNDAFSCAHRAHASTEGITKLLPSFAGPSLMAELTALSAALDAPERPVAALVGGAKVSSKIAVLEHLVSRTDLLIIGGGMANTFLYAQGHQVGKSLCEEDLADTARTIMAAAEKAGCEVLLPIDVVAADAFKAGAHNVVTPADQAPADMMILDVGPASIEALKTKLATCKTLLWNGPLGAFEIDPFGTGTFAIAKAAAELTKAGKLVTVAGGGDTVAALNAAGVADDFTYVSTAGGAFLEWMEGKELPGVAALTQPELMTEEA